MSRHASLRPTRTSRLSFWLLAAFLVVLWIAGGASRADVLGQPVVRFCAWAIIVFAALSFERFPWRRAVPVLVILVAAIVVVAAHLLPLPPGVWSALPGRALLLQAADVSGQPQPWRPLSISPGGTVNALGSLVVPACVLVLAVNLDRDQQWRICGLLIALIFAGCILALVQFTGANFGNPFINYIDGAVSGNFANRNHFALFAAMGCLLVPVWVLHQRWSPRWTLVAAAAPLPFILLVVLGTGSRAGLVLGAAAFVIGLAIAWRRLRQVFAALPRAATLAIAIIAFVLLVGVVVLAIVMGRATAVDRAVDLSAIDDLRTRALPFVIDTIGRYFPVGAGFGTFDPVYRIHEPDSLLQVQFFNHAHNDWLEVLLDGGVLGAALLLGAVGWFIHAGLKALRSRSDQRALALLGAGMIALVMLASIPDYPARTPLMMTILVIAASWLNGVGTTGDYPTANQSVHA